jgi:hypothetical protein
LAVIFVTPGKDAIGKFLPWEAKNMNADDHIKTLRIALIATGLIFIFGIWPLTVVWPSGWAWHTEGRSEYLEMILGIYATLGVFLIMASRNPMANLSLIRFTVWSSIIHACVMAFESVVNTQHVGHLWGDVPALLIIAAVLAGLTPRQDTNAHNT